MQNCGASFPIIAPISSWRCTKGGGYYPNMTVLLLGFEVGDEKKLTWEYLGQPWNTPDIVGIPRTAFLVRNVRGIPIPL